MTTIVAKKCPFCGGKAEIVRELNCDTLYVEHAAGCFIKDCDISHYHFNEPNIRPEKPFSGWETRVELPND